MTVPPVGAALVTWIHRVIVKTLVNVTTVEKTGKMTKNTYFRVPSTSRMKGVDFLLVGCAMGQQKSAEETADGYVNAVYAAMHVIKNCKTTNRNTENRNPRRPENTQVVAQQSREIILKFITKGDHDAYTTMLAQIVLTQTPAPEILPCNI